MNNVEQRYLELLKKMEPETKFELFFKTNSQVFNMARFKIKSIYPELDPLTFSKKFYSHLDLKRKFYDDLFNQLLQKELDKIC